MRSEWDGLGIGSVRRRGRGRGRVRDTALSPEPVSPLTSGQVFPDHWRRGAQAADWGGDWKSELHPARNIERVFVQFFHCRPYAVIF